MAKVRFNLRANGSKDAHIQMIYRISGDSKKLVIGTKRHVNPKQWNPKTMRVREVKGDMDAVVTNQILDKWEQSLNRALQPFKLESIQPSKMQLKEAVLTEMFGKSGNVSVGSTTDFQKYFEEFIELRKKTGLAKSTIVLYQNAYNHISNYRSQVLRNATIEFSDMDQSFFIEFIQYLGKSMQQNTIRKVIKQIRIVLNDAAQNGIAVNLDYKKKHTQVAFVKQPKIYLSEEEIEMVVACYLEPFSRLDKLRDKLFVGLDTGQRFSDFNRLNETFVTQLDSGKEVFRIKNQKTGTMVIIPIKERVKTILAKYKGFPPVISEQKFNEYVKELLKFAGVNRKVSRIVDGKQVIYEKWQLASSHMCRRSFATNSFKAGIHPKLVMPITGHKTVKQFMEYICIDDEESTELIINHPFFK